MLPSWLDFWRPSLNVALLERPTAQQSWLGRNSDAWSIEQSGKLPDVANLLTSFDSLLAAKAKPAKKWHPSPVAVAIVLPDHLARFDMLPWVGELMLADELTQFAIERFEMINQPVREGWVVQADWTSRNASTLAYALPHALLDGLQQIAQQHGLQLSRVIPISALAHYGRNAIPRRNELRVMHSGANTSALLYLDGKLVTHLIETNRGNTADGIRRLIARLHMSALTPEIKLEQLAVVGIDPIKVKEIIEANLPKRVHSPSPLNWREWQ